MSVRRDQRGHAVAVEAAVILPALVLFVALVVVLARGALVQQSIGAAASLAARAASLERTTSSAEAAAESALARSLAEAGVGCRERRVTVDTAGLRAPLGTPAVVTVSVVCVLPHDVALPGFPSRQQVSVTRTSPVDSYRGR